jgi:Fibronectin type III domain
MRRIVLLLASMALAVLFCSGVALAESPTTKEDCKNGGYAKYAFKNQGQCFKAVNPPPDTTAPKVQITSGPADGSSITTRQATFEFSSPDSDLARFDCSIRALSGPGVPWEDVDPNCTSPWTFAGLVDGTTYEFKVTAFDNAENSQSAVRTFTVDTTPPADTVPPEITVTGPEGTTTRTRATYFLEANEPVTWDCTSSFTPAGESEPRPEVTTGCYGGYMSWDVNTDGTYLFTFKATDAAGNTSAVTKTLILDRTVPT